MLKADSIFYILIFLLNFLTNAIVRSTTLSYLVYLLNMKVGENDFVINSLVTTKLLQVDRHTERYTKVKVIGVVRSLVLVKVGYITLLGLKEAVRVYIKETGTLRSIRFYILKTNLDFLLVGYVGFLSCPS